MELSILSFPHAYHRIFADRNLFCLRSSFVAATRKLRSRAAVSLGPDLHGSAPHLAVLGFLDCGLDREWVHARRRKAAAAGHWQRREWRCQSVDSEANESGESSPGSVHFVGIGGLGLSALALLALRQVHFVVANSWDVGFQNWI